MNLFKDQIELRREGDEEQYQNAFASLLSILDADFVRRSGHEAVSGAIAEVLGSIGVTPPEIPDAITDLSERLDYILRPSNTMRRRVELNGKWWKNASGALLAGLVDGGVVAIVQDGLGRYRYRDSDGKTVRINKKNAKALEKDAFCFYPSFPARELTITDLVRFMLNRITPSDIIMMLLVSAAVTLAGLLTPYANKQVFESVVPSELKSNIFPIASLVIGAAIGSATFGAVRTMVMSRFQENISMAVQSAAMSRVFALPATFFKEYAAGDLSSRVSSLNGLCTMLISTALNTGLAALFSMTYIFSMAAYAPELTLPAFIVISAMMAFSVFQTFAGLKINRKLLKTEAELSGLSFALLSGIQKIKLAGAEKRAFGKWSLKYAENATLTYRPPMHMRLSSSIFAFLTLAGTVWLYYLAGANHITPSNYMAFNAAYGQTSAAFFALSGIVATIAGIKPTMEMVAPLLKAVPESSADKEIVRSLSGSIEVTGLTFRYDKDSPPIVDDMSLKIKSGEFVAIVGKTGCGKSTLLRLLLGFETPERGSIYYDGKDLQHLDKPSVRRKIGVCMQNGKLFSGDVYSNIVVTAPDKNLDDAWAAAELAGFADDIRAMPMGMHTLLSEGGGGISGGQKQRLMIARALISVPKILLFDEATSALDNITQKRVTESVSSLKCTRVVIAHRLSTIQNADRIIMLENGRIVEQGTFDELIERKGRFYDMAKQQIL